MWGSLTQSMRRRETQWQHKLVHWSNNPTRNKAALLAQTCDSWPGTPRAGTSSPALQVPDGTPCLRFAVWFFLSSCKAITSMSHGMCIQQADWINNLKKECGQNLTPLHSYRQTFGSHHNCKLSLWQPFLQTPALRYTWSSEGAFKRKPAAVFHSCFISMKAVQVGTTLVMLCRLGAAVCAANCMWCRCATNTKPHNKHATTWLKC